MVDKVTLAIIVQSRVARLKGEVQDILWKMRMAEMDQLKSLAALDACSMARDLREIADRIEGVAKDYSREKAA